MNSQLDSRLLGLKNIIEDINENMSVIDFLIINLHSEKFNYANNNFIKWLWKTTVSQQIISLYHVIHDKEYHSFQKILNLSKEAKIMIDYEKLGLMIAEIKELYFKYELESVRSKFIAHKDINPKIIETDMKSVKFFTYKLINIYQNISEELNYSHSIPVSNVVLSMFEIFGHINQYENLLKYIKFEKSKGRETFTLADFIKFSTL